jgi:hypothetical protein
MYGQAIRLSASVCLVPSSTPRATLKGADETPFYPYTVYDAEPAEARALHHPDGHSVYL